MWCNTFLSWSIRSHGNCSMHIDERFHANEENVLFLRHCAVNCCFFFAAVAPNTSYTNQSDEIKYANMEWKSEQRNKIHRRKAKLFLLLSCIEAYTCSAHRDFSLLILCGESTIPTVIVFYPLFRSTARRRDSRWHFAHPNSNKVKYFFFFRHKETLVSFKHSRYIQCPIYYKIIYLAYV